MGINLTADPAQLHAASVQMGTLADQYQAAYTRLIQAVQNTQSFYQGGDAQQFVQKVLGFQDDFTRMYNLLKGASNDLRESSEKYSTTQDTARSRAAGLRDSI